MESFIELSITHIYREFNKDIDLLSKKVVEIDEGTMLFEEIFDNSVISEGA